MEDKDKQIWTKKLQAGSRTYFFEIKIAENGDKYLKIIESKKVGEQYEHHRVFVFQEDIYSFNTMFQEAIKEFDGTS